MSIFWSEIIIRERDVHRFLRGLNCGRYFEIRLTGFVRMSHTPIASFSKQSKSCYLTINDFLSLTALLLGATDERIIHEYLAMHQSLISSQVIRDQHTSLIRAD